MTDEERERTMEFILAQQAQFAADIIQIKEIQVQFGRDLHQVGELQAQSVEDIRQLREAETTLLRAMTTVVASTGEINTRVSRLETALAELAERISAFIAALRNGRPET